jgi:hypothetical protein
VVSDGRVLAAADAGVLNADLATADTDAAFAAAQRGRLSA